MVVRNLRLIFSIIYLFAVVSINASTASDVVAKAATLAKTAKGINAQFSIKSGNSNITGVMKGSGSKFALTTPSFSTWYNGKNMWTYNSVSKETTLVLPTKAELAESNPFVYLNSYTSDYTASFSAKKRSGCHVVNLTPKSKKNPIKLIEIAINSKTYKPENFLIIPKSGSPTTINIISLNYNISLKSSEFEYPKNKYPKVQIIDLR